MCVLEVEVEYGEGLERMGHVERHCFVNVISVSFGGTGWRFKCVTIV